jgi:4-hydroxybenzoate polyprenyltransferase
MIALAELRDYAYLMRLHRPIGIWLLMWPMLWALWLAAGGLPDLRVLVIMLAGTVLMRSAGCIINDFADRDFDPHVRRTRDRPLAARRIAPQSALLLFAALIAAAFLLVLQLDRFTILLSFAGAGLAISYPFFKRFFPAPQFYLGVAFGWAVPMAFAAQTGSISRLGWLLLLIAILWAAIYDTLYAMVDRDDDMALGLKSTALLFGDMDRVIIGAMQGLMLFGLVLVGRNAQLGYAYWLSLVGVVGLFAYQQWLAKDRDRDRCFRAFLNNHYVGMLVFIGIATDLWHR